MVTVLGLGLCIDYGLLIVSRYREELRAAAGDEQPTRSTRGARDRGTGRDHGHRRPDGDVLRGHRGDQPVRSAAVPRRRSCAPSARPASASWSVALLVALTLVPALLALCRRADDQAGSAQPIPGFRQLVAEARRRRARGRLLLPARPLDPTAALAGGRSASPPILGILAAPALRMELRSSGAELLPPSAPDRQFFDTLAADYPALRASPPSRSSGRRRPSRWRRWPPRSPRWTASSWCRRRPPSATATPWCSVLHGRTRTPAARRRSAIVAIGPGRPPGLSDLGHRARPPR